MLIVTVQLLLMSTVSAGGGGHKKKILIHVPIQVKHHHHTHTVYKHIVHEVEGHGHGGHGGGEGGGGDHEHYHHHDDFVGGHEGVVGAGSEEDNGWSGSNSHYKVLGYTHGDGDNDGVRNHVGYDRHHTAIRGSSGGHGSSGGRHNGYQSVSHGGAQHIPSTVYGHSGHAAEHSPQSDEIWDEDK